MGSFSVWHWIIVLVVILIVFGAGKLPKVAGDLASGIKNFKKGLQETPREDEAAGTSTAGPAKTLEGNAAAGEHAPVKDKAAQG